MLYFYKLASNSREAFNLTHEAYDAETRVCPDCHNPRPGVKEFDAVFDHNLPSREALNMVLGCGVGVAHKEFLSALGEDIVRRDLYLGRCYTAKGKLIDDWSTFIGKHLLIVRGDKHAEYRICPVCGRTCYFATGQKHLHGLPPKEVSIFDERDGGLVVTAEVMERIDVKKWRKLVAHRLPVLDEPLDGLGKLGDP